MTATKIKIEIKNRWTGKILFEYEKEENTIRETVLEAYKSDADLSRADLSGANLSGADLSDANLSRADLSDANLMPIKADMFYVLLHSIPEIKFLKQNIIEGKIDGSTYDGPCACLSGTLVNGARIHNGPKEKNVVDKIMECRDSSRPIERFFLSIRKGDTPETNQFSKLTLEWIEEFEMLLTATNP